MISRDIDFSLQLSRIADAFRAQLSGFLFECTYCVIKALSLS